MSSLFPRNRNEILKDRKERKNFLQYRFLVLRTFVLEMEHEEFPLGNKKKDVERNSIMKG